MKGKAKQHQAVKNERVLLAQGRDLLTWKQRLAKEKVGFNK